ncbi:hypothetical protein BJX65DRAFT_158532 [Aspergillus insuetus]
MSVKAQEAASFRTGLPDTGVRCLRSALKRGELSRPLRIQSSWIHCKELPTLTWMEESSRFPGAPDTISQACHWFWNSLKGGLWTLGGLSDDVEFASVACLHRLSRFAPFVCPSLPSPGTGKPHTANKHPISRISLTQAHVVATKNEFSPSILDGYTESLVGFKEPSALEFGQLVNKGNTD